MRIEEQRVRDEDETRRRSLEAAERARIEAERAAREGELATMRLVEARRAEMIRLEREEAARLESIRQGEIAKARIEAEQRARIEEIAIAQAHERELFALKEDRQKKSLKRALIAGGLIASTIIGGGTALYLGKLKPEADAQRAAQLAAIRARDDENKRLEEQSDALEKKIAELDRRAAETKDANDAAIAKAQSDAAKIEKDKVDKQKHLGVTHRDSAAPANAPCHCQYAGDPSCGCLER